MSSFTKSVELALRRQFNKWFRADRNPIVVQGPDAAIDFARPSDSTSATNATSNTDATSDMRTQRLRLLVLRQDRIGDVLISTPIVRALRARYPDAHIDALLSDNNIGARRAYEPYINNVLRYSKSVVGIATLRAQMRANAYDVVVDMTDNASSTSSMLVTMSNARYAVGVDKENRGVYTHVVPRVPRDAMHIVERIVRLLWPFGIDPATVDKHMEYRISTDERAEAERMLPNVLAEAERMLPNVLAEAVHGLPRERVRVGVNLSGSTPSRRFEVQTLVAVIEALRAKYELLDFYIFTTPDLIKTQQAVCAATAAAAVPVSASFHAYACALSCMHVLVTPDTAAVHLAAAWQMPSVVLYRPEVPAVYPWYPYNSYSVPCTTTSDSIANIPAAEITAAIETMLIETRLVRAS